MRPAKPPKWHKTAHCPVYGKVQHKTENGAQVHAMRLANSRGFSGVPALPYRCDGCGDWHVGHSKFQGKT